MTEIITLTINPAVDLATSVEKMAPFSKLRCAPPHRDPGGGGINVARVLKRLGCEVTAIFPAGGPMGLSLEQLLAREGVASLPIQVASETREDITVIEQSTHLQYRFVMPGPKLSETEWRQCLDAVGAARPEPRFVVASGSLPAGVPEDFYGHLARAAQALGSKAVVDAPGWLLKPAIEAGLYLIKPNLREFQTLAGIESADPTELIAAARALIDRYPVELIALSMGCDGALLVGRDLAWRAEGLPIAPASVSGAGDSFLGAMLWSLLRHDDLSTALRFGVAAGSAALLHPGTELCLRADVERLAAQVVVTTVVGC